MTKKASNKNNKKGSNNFLWLSIILIVMGTLAALAIARPSNTVQANKNKQYEEVMELDIAGNYPDSPDGVLDKYNQIESFLSGNTTEKLTDGDLRSLVEKQRLLLHSELLALNPIDAQIQGYSDKIELLKKEEMRVMQITSETPRFSNDGNSCSIGVKQYWNKYVQEDSRTIDLVYNLKKEGEAEKWKIIGWYVNTQQGE